MPIEIITQDVFSDTIKQHDTVLIDFYADWCGPCKMITPILEEILGEFNDLGIYKVNVDTAPELAAKYQVMSIPNLICFKNGEVHNRLIGVQTKEAILELVALNQ